MTVFNLRRVWVVLCGVLLGLCSAALATDPGRIEKGDTVAVAADGAEFHVEGVVAAKLKAGTPMKVAEVYDVWVGGSVPINGKEQLGWVLARRVVKKDDPAAAAALKKLPIKLEPDYHGNILRIDANDADLTGESLAHVKGLYSLEGLELSGTKITDADLAHLKELTNLQWLYLDNTRISDKGLVHLKDLSNLDVLALNKTQVTGPGLVHLKLLTKLRVLNLSNCKISDDGLQHVSGLSQIQTLALQETPISGDGLKHLKPAYGKRKELISGLPRLNVVNLNKCKLADKMLLHFKDFEELRILHLEDAEFDAESKEELDDALPSLAIFD